MIAGRRDADLGGSARLPRYRRASISTPTTNGSTTAGRSRRGDPLYRPLGAILAEVWARYGRPIMIAETGRRSARRPAVAARCAGRSPLGAGSRPSDRRAAASIRSWTTPAGSTTGIAAAGSSRSSRTGAAAGSTLRWQPRWTGPRRCWGSQHREEPSASGRQARGGADLPRAIAPLEPAFVAQPHHRHHDTEDDQHKPVLIAVSPVVFRHRLEVHAVEPDHEGRRNADD